MPADGDYYLRFTDFMYNGGAENFYRLSIGTQPYLDFITPTGAKPGTTAEITFFGRNLPGGEKTDIKVNGRPLEKVVRKIAVPSDPETITSMRFREMLRPPTRGWMAWKCASTARRAPPTRGCSSSATGRNCGEIEPNDTIDDAQEIPVPCAVTGQFSAPKDADHLHLQREEGREVPDRGLLRAHRFARRSGHGNFREGRKDHQQSCRTPARTSGSFVSRR